MPDPANPLIVQADRSLYLETFNPHADEARTAISPCAELEKSPEHLHTYRLKPLSLWNAVSSGVRSGEIVEALERYSKFPVPENVMRSSRDWMLRRELLRVRENVMLLGYLNRKERDAALGALEGARLS